MQKFNEKKVSSIINAPKEGQKPYLSKPQKIKSHIIFKGDPAFHYDSVQYVPVNRRKRIFEDNQQNILPPDLLLNQQALLEHNNNLQVQQQIHQNIIGSFERQMDPFGYNIYSDQNKNGKKRILSQQEEIYFEPNNLETDLNFGIMVQNQEYIYPAIHSSKASQTTQKKGQIYVNNINQLKPSQINAIPPTTQPAGQIVNFSYQGKVFSKENDQIIESRVKKVTTVMNKSPKKSNSKTIFVNEGGVMVPKKNKKIEMQESDYFDFDVNNQEANERNESLINELKLTETPQFNIKNGKSSEIINNFFNQDYNSYDSQKNVEKYRKSMSDGNKILIEGRNSPSKLNNVNSSIASYKSVQKHFDNQALQNQTSKAQSINQPILDIKSSKNSQIQAQQSLINQIFESNFQPKKQKRGVIDESMSSQQQDSASLFDKILRERQSIFNKNKQPEVDLKKKKSERKNNNGIDGNSNGANVSNTVQKPADFITDSHFAPTGFKRSINIGSMLPAIPSSKIQQTQSKIVSEAPILQSKVKKVQLKTETIQNKNKYTPSKSQNSLFKIQQSTKNNLKSSKMKSNESIPQSVGKEDDEEEDYEDEDFIQEEESSSSQSSLSQKQVKFNKTKRQTSKLRKKKHENDINLEDYLKKQQQKIQLKEIKKIMENVPEIKNNLKKKSKKNKLQQQKQQYTEQITIPNQNQNQQPVVYTAPNQLNPLQRQLLQTVGIKLIQDSIPKNQQPQLNQFFNQSNQLQNQNRSQLQSNGSQMREKFQQNMPYFFNYHSQMLQKQNEMQRTNIQNSKMSEKIIGAPFSQYHKNHEDYEKKFEEITKVLYSHLVNFVQPSNITHPPQSQFQNRIQHTTTNKEPRQIGSAFSFKNQSIYQQQSKTPKISSVDQTVKTFERSDNDQNRFAKQKGQLYNKEIYDELRRFNTSKHNKRSSRQKQKLSFDGSQIDDTHYYSFYHDDQEDLKNNKSSTFYQTDNYYPMKKDKKRLKEMSSEKSLKGRFELKNSSQLGLLYQKIQQLSNELHEELPLIRKQIEENQHEIRKIQTNLLIKNTAEQHTLIKALQKMKIKDRELQEKQIQAQNRNHQLSMCQNQLAALKTQYITNNNQFIQNIEKENYFQNRLHKLQNYNEKLCSQLSHFKTPIQPTFIPERLASISQKNYFHFI